MKVRRLIAILALITLVLGLSVPAGAAKTVTLKIANYYAPDHPVNQGFYQIFKPMVESKSNGSIKVQIYPNSQLGAEQEFVEGVQLGTIEMALTGNLWENTIPEFRVVQLPYMFVSYDHANEILNGPVGQKIYQYIKPLGVRILASFPNGFRAVSNSKKPINSIDDCKGIRLRVFQGDIIIKEMQALGFTTVVMPISEIFTALQQKVVDGQENPIFTLYYSGWYEVQKYVAMTKHMYGPGYVVINEKVWNSLSKDQQQLIQAAASETASWILNKMKNEEDDIIKKLQAAGLVITYPDLKPFMQRVAPIVDEYVKQYPHMKPIIDEIRKAGEKYL